MFRHMRGVGDLPISDEFAAQYAVHEGAVSVAFQTLLADTARRHHWTLIPQLTAKGIRPDGTLKDPMGLVRGHWEAKDSADKLGVEISKKIQKGYPLGNIIFEDTLRAVLYQNKTEVMRIDLRDREQITRLLQTFFEYVEPQIDSFCPCAFDPDTEVMLCSMGRDRIL